MCAPAERGEHAAFVFATSSRKGGTIGGRAPGRVGRALLLGVALFTTACTAEPEPVATPAPARPPGSIVAFTQDTAAPPLVAFDVTTSTVRPAGQAVRDPTASAAAATGDELVGVVVSRGGRTTVLRLGEATTPVGPPLDGPRDADYRSLSIAAGRVLVADCRSVSVLDLSVPGSWRTLGRGCWGALSPDGSRAVYSPDGGTVLEARTGGGGPTRLFDPADAVDLGTDEAPRLFGAPAWGEAGIAFTAIAGDQAGVFLRRPDGEIVPLMQEKLLKTARPPVLAWRPDGGLLAMMDDLGSGGALRTFDPVSGARRVVALDALAFDGLLWSPDGSSLATLTSAGALLVVGTDDLWRARVETTWNAMLGWLP